jgi:D-alanyl-D-alanine carboxypeptidase
MRLWKDRWSALVAAKNPALAWNAHSAVAVVVLALAVFSCGSRSARAAVHASIVIDAQSGEVLHAHNADRRAHPASLAKLMTLYITFQQLDSGKLTLHQELPVSSHAAAQPPTKLYLRPGSEISVRSAILGIVTKSANDAAVVLAEGIAGSEPRFARIMTQKARELGMQRTTFYNASGLPNARQWTTARDMSNLALAIINDYPAYYHFFGVRSFTFHGRRVYGHDHLLDRYPGADGLKTGFIRASGYNLVTSAVRHHRRLVGVVMGGSSARSRDRHMMTLLNRGFSRRSTETLEARATDPPPTPQPKRASLKLASDVVQDDDADAPDAGHWIVQVGGNFLSAHSVRRVLKSAIRSAPSVLSPDRELVVKLRAHRYRARFSHLSEHQAVSACRALRRKKFTCRILNYQVPSNDLAGVSGVSTSQSD